VAQVAAPPTGFVEDANPFRVPTQSVVEGHATSPRTPAGTDFQAEAPAPGSVEVITLPVASVATHRFRDGQESPWIAGAPGRDMVCHSPPTLAGLDDTKRFPASSAVTQNVPSGQEIAVSRWDGSTTCAVQDTAEAGSVEVST
jgi:hypothetical protein